MAANKDQTVAQAVEVYQAWRKARGLAENTLIRDCATLNKLVDLYGRLQVSSLTATHIDDFFMTRKTLAERTQNVDLSTLRVFFRFLDSRGYHKNALALLHDYRPIRYTPDPRRRIPVGEFPALLDAAGDPRDRIFVAVGLYLFLRASEIRALKVKDVDLASGEVAAHIFKTKDSDAMPISSELDKELRRWLKAYQDQAGPLEPDWFLIPALIPTAWVRDDLGRMTNQRVWEYQPERFISVPERIVHKALKAHGWPDTLKEGCHTLRRSGARALYDELAASDGHTNALETVSAMLHHKTFAMTQHYLGLTESRRKRDSLIRGKSMFPSLEDVTTLPPLRSLDDRAVGDWQP